MNRRLGFFFLCLASAVMADLPQSAVQGEAANGADGASATHVDFADDAVGSVPRGFTAVGLTAPGAAQFRISTSHGRRVLTDVGASSAVDVYYYKTTPRAAIEESYSFVYSGPDSVVEPFFVNTEPKNPDAVEGFITDLSPSHPGNNSAGSIVFRYTDDTGHVQRAQRGRLRTEPYLYKMGTTYRVDAIVDDSAGLLTTRIYDAALGPQTFDLSVKTTEKRTYYPGIRVQRGAAAILDFAFGPAGKLPMRAHTARRAADYMDYLGYNAGVIGPASSPISQAFQRYFPQLLIRHVRVPAEMRFLPSINAVARYGIDADVLTGNKTTLAGLNRFITSLSRPPDAIELWNEPNNPSEGAAYDPQYLADLPPFAAQVAQAYPHTKIWGPSVLPENGYPSAGAKQLSSLLGSYITAWNAHSYTQGAPENLGYGGFFSNACGPSHKEDCGWYGAPNYNDNLSAVVNPNLPGITTEGAASYGSYPQVCGHSNVDTATQAAYIQRGLLYNFKLGHLRIFPYKFIDDGGCSDGFGTYGIMAKIIDSSGQPDIEPKPAYTSLVFLSHILVDDGANAATFNPKPLNYSLDGATTDLEQLLLAESDGTFRLVLWSDKSLWDFNARGPRVAGSAIPPARTTVRLKFATSMTTTVYSQTPGSGAWSAAGARTGSAVDVAVDQYPLVVMIAAPATTNRPVALPHDVPTPGPSETPRVKGLAQPKPAQ